MQRDFLLPDAGEGLEDATIVRWHVQAGDTVHLNDPLVTIETAKASVELPSPFEGRVLLLGANEGDELRVGTLLARIDTDEGEGEPAPRSPDAGLTSPDRSIEPSSSRDPPPGWRQEDGSGPSDADRWTGDAGSVRRHAVLVGYGVDDGPRPATRRREWRRRKAPGEVASTERDQAGDGLPRPPAPPPERALPSRPLATPPVRWLARTLEVDLRHVRPTGARGEVTREDVHAAVGPAAPTGHASAAGEVVHGDPAHREAQAWWPPGLGASPVVPGTVGPGGAPAASVDEEGAEELPVRGVRARIAERMSVSRATIPEATCGLWVDCERLLAVRSALGDDSRSGHGQDHGDAEVVTPFAVLAWMVPVALRTAPLLNARFDAEAKVIRVHRAVHLGVATSTELGLLVPVVHRAHALGLRQFVAELARLSGAARHGTLTPAELTGSTFTVTNYGALGLDDGNPVINAPEAAILGVGTIAPRAVVHDGELAVRSTAKLVCAFDHRVADGADAARFLRRLKALVEQPELLLGAR